MRNFPWIMRENTYIHVLDKDRARDPEVRNAIINIERDLKSIDNIISHLENVLESTLTTINKNSRQGVL